MNRVVLFYDILSPYSWIGFELIMKLAPKWQVPVTLRPFLLAGIMKGSGNRPPGLVPNKMKWMVSDISIQKEMYGIPFNFPANAPEKMFVKGSITTQRFLTALVLEEDQLQKSAGSPVRNDVGGVVEAVTRQLWIRMWSTDEDITQPEVILDAARKGGLSEERAKRCLEATKTDRIKDALKQTTQEALDEGAFGAPTFLVYSQGGQQKNFVFGSDRMHVIAYLLGKSYEDLASEARRPRAAL